jgi:hypothetical protein
MADRGTSGTEYFAYTGVATIRPTDSMMGTCSVRCGAENDDFITLSAWSREQSERYRFAMIVFHAGGEMSVRDGIL